MRIGFACAYFLFLVPYYAVDSFHLVVAVACEQRSCETVHEADQQDYEADRQRRKGSRYARLETVQRAPTIARLRPRTAALLPARQGLPSKLWSLEYKLASADDLQ